MEPVAKHNAANGGGDPGEDLEDGSPVSSPKDLALFAVLAARQHFVLCLFVAAMIGILGSAVVAAIPSYYDSTFMVFIEEGGAVTSSLASGRERFRPIEGARGLDEFLFSRANLLAIAREAKLVDTWHRTRTLPMHLKDQAMQAVFGPPDRNGMERVFAEMLSGLIVGTKEGDSVVVHAQWRERENAYDIAKLLMRNFLAARAAHDLGPIQRAIPFLESQQQQADEAIETAVTRVQTATTRGAGAAAAAPAPSPGAPQAKNSASDASLLELANLSRQLAEARRQQRVLVEPWRQRLAELKVQQLDIKVQYSPEHPLYKQLEARIAAASEVPEEIAQLRATEASLLNTLSSRSGVASPAGGDGPEGAPEKPADAAGDPPELALPKARLFAALRKSDEVTARLEDARIELATAEADFKHRYVVVEEPELPGAPLKGKKPMLSFVVLIVAILAGIGAATAKEMLRGRLVEPWQVRSLGLPLLAEVDLKKLQPQNTPERS